DPENDQDLERELPAIFRDADILAVEKSKPTEPVQAVVPIAPPAVVAEIVPVVVAPVFQMRLMTPTGITQFDWHNEKDLPQESPLSGSATQPAVAPETPATDNT